jgi:hypothetical protein
MQDLPSELGPVLVVSLWKKHGHGRNGINREIEQIEAKIKCLDEASREIKMGAKVVQLPKLRHPSRTNSIPHSHFLEPALST